MKECICSFRTKEIEKYNGIDCTMRRLEEGVRLVRQRSEVVQERNTAVGGDQWGKISARKCVREWVTKYRHINDENDRINTSI